MPSYLDALTRILEDAAPRPSERVPLGDALGLVLAEDVVAAEPLPPFANSAMDGFAVRAHDIEHATGGRPERLAVLEDVPAGRMATTALLPGTAIRIMTGAPLPAGADTVVRVEDTSSEGRDVLVSVAARVGANVREAGEDVHAGEVVLQRGTVLRAAEIGLLAAIGCAAPPVFPRVRVAVITTGDELVDVAEPLGPGRIRDANLHSMCAQVAAAGAVPIPIARVPDRHDAVRGAIERALAEADVIVTNGGISVGDYDFIKTVLDEFGAQQVFWKVAQKPGGPFAYYDLIGRPLFGVPGNPVAALVCLEEYVRPALRRMMGHTLLMRPERQATLATPFRKSGRDGKLHFIRVFAWEENGALHARIPGSQGSAILKTAVRSNALALVPADVIEIPAGAAVTVHLTDAPEDH